MQAAPPCLTLPPVSFGDFACQRERVCGSKCLFSYLPFHSFRGVRGVPYGHGHTGRLLCSTLPAACQGDREHRLLTVHSSGVVGVPHVPLPFLHPDS